MKAYGRVIAPLIHVVKSICTCLLILFIYSRINESLLNNNYSMFVPYSAVWVNVSLLIYLFTYLLLLSYLSQTA
jgi:hypothetical protein